MSGEVPSDCAADFIADLINLLKRSPLFSKSTLHMAVEVHALLQCLASEPNDSNVNSKQSKRVDIQELLPSSASAILKDSDSMPQPINPTVVDLANNHAEFVHPLYSFMVMLGSNHLYRKGPVSKLVDDREGHLQPVLRLCVAIARAISTHPTGGGALPAALPWFKWDRKQALVRSVCFVTLLDPAEGSEHNVDESSRIARFFSPRLLRCFEKNGMLGTTLTLTPPEMRRAVLAMTAVPSTSAPLIDPISSVLEPTLAAAAAVAATSVSAAAAALASAAAAAPAAVDSNGRDNSGNDRRTTPVSDGNASRGEEGCGDGSGQDCNRSSKWQVYVTPRGRKYHKPHCIYLRSNPRSIGLAEAEEGGMAPCRRCYHGAVQQAEAEAGGTTYSGAADADADAALQTATGVMTAVLGDVTPLVAGMSTDTVDFGLRVRALSVEGSEPERRARLSRAMLEETNR
jgi:hypothetical protein